MVQEGSISDFRNQGDPVFQIGGLRIWIGKEVPIQPCKIFGRKVELIAECLASNSLCTFKALIPGYCMRQDLVEFREFCTGLIQKSVDEAILYLHDPENVLTPSLSIQLMWRDSLGHFTALVSLDPDSGSSGSLPGTNRTCEYQVEFVLDLISIEEVILGCDKFIGALAGFRG